MKRTFLSRTSICALRCPLACIAYPWSIRCACAAHAHAHIWNAPCTLPWPAMQVGETVDVYEGGVWWWAVVAEVRPEGAGIRVVRLGKPHTPTHLQACHCAPTRPCNCADSDQKAFDIRDPQKLRPGYNWTVQMWRRRVPKTALLTKFRKAMPPGKKDEMDKLIQVMGGRPAPALVGGTKRPACCCLQGPARSAQDLAAAPPLLKDGSRAPESEIRLRNEVSKREFKALLEALRAERAKEEEEQAQADREQEVGVGVKGAGMHSCKMQRAPCAATWPAACHRRHSARPAQPRKHKSSRPRARSRCKAGSGGRPAAYPHKLSRGQGSRWVKPGCMHERVAPRHAAPCSRVHVVPAACACLLVCDTEAFHSLTPTSC